MFKITNATSWTAAAGEGILLDVQEADYDGVVASLAMPPRPLVLTIWTGAEVLYHELGTTMSDTTGEFARWILPGIYSESWRGRSGLRFQVAEEENDGLSVWMAGTLTIEDSAPVVEDFNNAPYARYISRIQRIFDPVYHGVDPQYKITYAKYGVVAPYVPPASTVQSATFNTANNSALIAVLGI